MRASLVMAVLLVTTGDVSAQPPIESNDFNIDLVNGPVLAGSRVVGMGGAYSAIATGVDGVPWNPASVAARTLWEHDNFEWGLSFGLLFPGAFSDTDFFNSETEVDNVDDLFFINLGAKIQYGNLGVGFLLDILSLDVGAEDGRTHTTTLLVGHLTGGYGLLGGQVIVGGGFVLGQLTLSSPVTGNIYQVNGVGLEAGGMLAFEGQRWRLGASGRTPPLATSETISDEVEDIGGVQTVSGTVLPSGIEIPWEVRVGFAYQFGRRPLNVRWERPPDPIDVLRADLADRQCARNERQLRAEMEAAGQTPPAGVMCPNLPRAPADPDYLARDWELRRAEGQKMADTIEDLEDAMDRVHERYSRNYYLLSSELFLVGNTIDGVGVDAFFDQRRRVSGDDVGVGVRVGFEFEPWRNRLKLRAGSYLEPARYEESTYRMHGTVGMEMRLFRIPFLDIDLSVTGVFDGAPRYISWGVGVGIWH